jgi:hypothetical protein
MSVVVEVVIPTVLETGLEIAVWDNFCKFKAESAFFVGLESFFSVEGFFEEFEKFIFAIVSPIPFEVWPLAVVPIKNIRLFKTMQLDYCLTYLKEKI